MNLLHNLKNLGIVTGGILILPYKFRLGKNAGKILGHNSLLITLALTEVRFIYNVRNIKIDDYGCKTIL